MPRILRVDTNLLRFPVASLRECLRQKPHQIRRHQRILADGFAGQIPCQSMKVDSESSRFERMPRMLRDQPSDHSGENVSRAAGSHARIAGRIHPDRAVGRCDKRAMPFEYDHQLVLASEVARDLQAVRLNFGNRQAGQARHFSWVRSDNESSPMAVQFVGRSFEGIQPVGVDSH